MKWNIFKRSEHEHTTRQRVRSVVPKSKWFGADPYVLLMLFLVCFFGILMVYDSSVAIARRDFGDQYYFVREQIKWVILGAVVLIAVSKIDYHLWYVLAIPLLIGTLILLCAVFVPGIGVKALGARRWINLGFTVVQPAELAKLVLIMYLSAWFSHYESGRFLAYLMLLGIFVGLIILEPDLGTGIVLIAIAFLLYFLSGAPLRHFVFLVPVLIAGVFALSVFSPYRYQRLLTFVDPNRDPLGASYHIRQALMALGSGGWFGVGVGKSRQKYEFLPEANTDSIFAVIAEETGFIGAGFLLLAFLFLVWRGFRIARRAPDIFGRLLSLGISIWVGVQVALNIAAMVALVPLTGIPLPFISSGGSSLVVMLAAMGVLLNVSRQRK